MTASVIEATSFPDLAQRYGGNRRPEDRRRRRLGNHGGAAGGGVRRTGPAGRRMIGRGAGRTALPAALAAAACLWISTSAGQTPRPVEYHLSLPAPQHRWLAVDVRFDDVGRAPLHVRMSSFLSRSVRPPRVRQEPDRGCLHGRGGRRDGGRPARTGPLGGRGARWPGTCPLPAVRRPRRRYVPGGRRDPRPHERPGNADVGGGLERPGGPRDADPAGGRGMEGRPHSSSRPATR